MVTLDDAVIARLKKAGETFELLVDADKAYAYKSGEPVKIEDVLASEFIFKDASKTDKASEEHVLEVLGKSTHLEIVETILKKGEIQLTSEKKKQLLANRKKQVITIIARNAINPQTGTPHPSDRLEKAMDEAKFHIDLHKSAKEQVEPALKAIRPILPIKFEKVEIAIKIPAEYAGKLYKSLHEFGELKKEEWIGGAQICVLEIPGGLQDELFDAISGQTHGEAELKKIEKNE